MNMADYNTENSDAGSQRALKMAVPNSAAGLLIGKGGATITMLQEQTSARIKLSRNKEFFPGTGDRVILVTGPHEVVLDATLVIVEKLCDNDMATSNSARGDQHQIKLIVPNVAAGGIIGKEGSHIKSVQEKTNARVQISPRDPERRLDERVVTITGGTEEVRAAVSTVAEKYLSEATGTLYNNMSTSYPQAMSPAFGYSNAARNFGSNMPSQNYGGYLGQVPQTVAPAGTSIVTMQIQDELIGALVGRSGRNIAELQSMSGAHIQISQKGDYVPGTNHRIVTLTGTPAATQHAHFMIQSKIQLEHQRLLGNRDNQQ